MYLHKASAWRVVISNGIIYIAEKCTNDEYRCWDGTCIPSSQHCDGVRNCSDDSDEVECGELTSGRA